MSSEGEHAPLLPRPTLDKRVHYIDNLRSLLVALVIFHHAALAFGGIGSWPYVSPYHPSKSSPILSLFVAVNQSYFMGMLFFLSGHLSAQSASRKSWTAFCADKLKRIGLPAVVYTLVVHPLVLILVWWSHHAPIQPALITYYRALNGVRGPVWYLAVLLFFDLIYITIRTCLPPFSFLIPTSATRYRVTAALCILAVSVGSYLIRLSHPVGRSTPPLGIQLAYALQYVLAYTAGTCLSSIRQYFLISTHPGQALALAYMVAIISLATIAISLRFGMVRLFDVLYAFWNELCFYIIGTTLYSFFHHSAHTTKRWGNTARYSYAVYILHALVVVALQILVDTVGGRGVVFGVIKTLVVGTLGVCISWAAAWILIRVPGVGKVL
ncbi:Acyltransferase 3 [Mycena sanguinolenta]|uniref:Acyltransferase 3 n=1 Tax=Mycena sanguinolenta TaxID=230812 RepID=A0A8H6ZI28_9AGAR|nr:Acyltransferase 3 [Mycena sanguinolenta]